MRIPIRAVISDLHNVRQQGCALREALSRVQPSGLTGAPELGLAGDICTCYVHPTRAAPFGCRVSSLFSQPVSQWLRSVSVEALESSVNALEPAPRKCEPHELFTVRCDCEDLRLLSHLAW